MDRQPESLEARLYPGPVQLVDFVREGWRRLDTKNLKVEKENQEEVENQEELLHSDNFFLTPALEPGWKLGFNNLILCPIILSQKENCSRTMTSPWDTIWNKIDHSSATIHPNPIGKKTTANPRSLTSLNYLRVTLLLIHCLLLYKIVFGINN